MADRIALMRDRALGPKWADRRIFTSRQWTRSWLVFSVKSIN